MRTLLLAGVAIVGFAGLSMSANAQQTATATVIDNKAAELGEINVKQAPKGVLLHVKLEGLPAGKHGFHIHETGNCEDHGEFKMAHGHIGKRDSIRHGLMNPNGYEEGDLPNLIVSEDGTVEVELFVPNINITDAGNMNKNGILLDNDGAAFMIHENPDDHMTQPIGGAGDRIACGVIHSTGLLAPKSAEPATSDTTTTPEAELISPDTEAVVETIKPEIKAEPLEAPAVQPAE